MPDLNAEHLDPLDQAPLAAEHTAEMAPLPPPCVGLAAAAALTTQSKARTSPAPMVERRVDMIGFVAGD